MGEDLQAEGRMAVRTPMQWSDTKNGGFSTAASRKLIQRVVPDGYAPEHVNVADQRNDPDSLWSFIRSLIAAYRQCPELGWGQPSIIDQPHRQVLAQRCEIEESAVITVHNLGAEPVSLDVPVDGRRADQELRVDDVLGREPVKAQDGAVQVSLEGYGIRWLRVSYGADQRLA